MKTSGRSLSWELKDVCGVRGRTGQRGVRQTEGTARAKALRWDRKRGWREAES